METSEARVMKVGVKKEFTDKQLSDLLCCAFEGGVNYWCRIEEYRMPEGEPGWEDVYLPAKHTWVPLMEGGEMYLREEDGERLVLNRRRIRMGLKKMAEKSPRHFWDFANESCDAETGDVFVQFCVYGRIVWG